MEYFIDDELDRIDLDAALNEMPAWRRECALALHHVGQRRQSVGAWLLLRRACRQVWGLSDVPAVRVGEHGKPYFPDRPDLHFNLSHCAVAAACVVDTQPVGIDIETVRPLRETLARRVLSEKERETLTAPYGPSGPSAPELTFTRLWTMKESLSKLTGTGLTVNWPRLQSLLDDYEGRIDFITIVGPADRYVCTVTRWST